MKRVVTMGVMVIGTGFLMLTSMMTTGCESCVDSGSLCPSEGADGCCSENCEEYNGYQICS